MPREERDPGAGITIERIYNADNEKLLSIVYSKILEKKVVVTLPMEESRYEKIINSCCTNSHNRIRFNPVNLE